MESFLSFLKRKYVIYGLVTVAVLGIIWLVFLKNNNNGKETLVVHAGDFLKQVSVSGKVVATENLNLSFEQSGIVRKIYIKTSDKVSIGQLLASQDTGQLYAQFSEMQAGIDLEKAKLTQLLAGASPEDIKISEDAVSLAIQNLNNAYQNTLISLSNAYSSIYNAYSAVVYTQSTYFSSVDQQGTKVQNSKNDISYSMTDAKNYLDMAKSNPTGDTINSSILNIISDLNSVYGSLSIIRSQCDEGIYYSKISSTDKTSLDNQKTNINTSLASLTSSQQSILGYKLSLEQAQSQLNLKKSPPRDTDTAVFEAQIKQAEASAQNVAEQIRKRQIFSPINGIVTDVNAKVGSVFSLSETAISVISQDKFQIESYVPEIYVSYVKVGDDAKITLDALGQDKSFSAKVISIDPSETIKDGVSTYKATLQFLNDEVGVKDGMTANAVITSERKSNVISIPQGLIISKNGQKFVKVKKDRGIIEEMVQTGDVSSSGYIEILSGLSDGDVLLSK